MSMFRIAAVLLCACRLLAASEISPGYFAGNYSQFQNTGPAANRVNIVVLSEAYTQPELDSAAFYTDAASLLSNIFSFPPFSDYKSYFNIYFCAVPSNVDTGAQANFSPADTLFQSFYTPVNSGAAASTPEGQQYLLNATDYGKSLVIQAINEIAQNEQGPYTSFFPILLVNNPTRGGEATPYNGVPIAITGNWSENVRLTLHELGHSIGRLGDEYSSAYTGFVPRLYPNVTNQTSRTQITWSNWIPLGVPIDSGKTSPGTPPIPKWFNYVGLFQGAEYQPTGWYRPTYSSLMRTLDDYSPTIPPYGAVNEEALIRAVYNAPVSLIDSVSPGGPTPGTSQSPTAVTISQPGIVTFQVSGPVPKPNHLRYYWQIDSPDVLDNNTPQLAFDPDNPAYGAPGLHTVVLTVIDQSPMLHPPLIQTPSALAAYLKPVTFTQTWSVNITYGGPNWVRLPFAIAPDQIVKGNGTYVVVESGPPQYYDPILMSGSSLHDLHVPKGPTGSPNLFQSPTATAELQQTSVQFGRGMFLITHLSNAGDARIPGTQYYSKDGESWFSTKPIIVYGPGTMAGGPTGFLLITASGQASFNGADIHNVEWTDNPPNWESLGDTIPNPLLPTTQPDSTNSMESWYTPQGILNIAYGNGRYVGLGGPTLRFHVVDPPEYPANFVNPSAYLNVALAENYVTLATVDGVHWQRGEGPPPPTNTAGFLGQWSEVFPYILFCNNYFFAFSSASDNGILPYSSQTYVWRSNNGISWTLGQFPSGYYGGPFSMCYGGGQYLFVFNQSQIYVSEDGLNWTLEPLDTTGLGIPNCTLKSCWYENGFFYVFGRGLYPNNSPFVLVKGTRPLYSPTASKGQAAPGQSSIASIAGFGAPQTESYSVTIQAAAGKVTGVIANGNRSLVKSGDIAPGIPGAIISSLGQPSGDAVLARLKVGPGGVTAAADVALITGLSSATPIVSAQTGKVYAGLQGQMTIRTFLAIDGNGTTSFFLADLQGNGVSATNALALCANDSTGGVNVLVRKGDSVDVAGQNKMVAVISTLVGSKGTLADGRWRVDDTDIGVLLTFADQSQAIYTIPASATSFADWSLCAVSGSVTTIPALSGTLISSFGLPGFGPAGFAVLANLVRSRNVTRLNDVALIASTGGNAPALVTRTGNPVLSDANGNSLTAVTVKSLSDPVEGANGAVAFMVTLAGSAFQANGNTGIEYAADGLTPVLIANSGAAAPVIGHWSSFSSLVLPSSTQTGPIFLGMLGANSADGVNPSNNLGLWGVDSTGTVVRLLGTGESVIVGTSYKTIKTFTALAASPGSIGAASGYDNNGNVAVLATFTDGTQSIVPISPP